MKLIVCKQCDIPFDANEDRPEFIAEICDHCFSSNAIPQGNLDDDPPPTFQDILKPGDN